MALSLKGQPHQIAAQKILRTVCICVAAVLLMAAGPRPVPENGNTVVLYTGRYPAFSLVDGLEFLKLQLQHFATELTTAPAQDASSNQIATADQLVIFCPQAEPGLPRGILAAIASRAGPTLWVGFGIEQLQAFDQFTNRFEVANRAANVPLGRVKYQGRVWDGPIYPWMPVALPTEADVVMSGFEARSGVAHPLCWQKTNFTFFAALPVAEMPNFLFTDMLFDFYNIKQAPPARVFLRIEDYSALSNHRELQRKADYLHSRGMPFMLAVIPAIRDPVTGNDLDLATAPEFAEALRYAQARGARLLICGDSRHEFWDPEQDRGLEPGIGDLKRSIAEFLARGLFPLAWETPEYSASRAAYREIATLFSTSVERVQLSDSTQAEKATPLGITVDAAGRLIVPENLGYVRGPESTNALGEIKSRAELLLRLRGAVLGGHIHAFQPLGKLVAFVQLLESFNVSFLDLADLPNAVTAPDSILLTSGARSKTDWHGREIRLRVFARNGRLIREEPREPTATIAHEGGAHYYLFSAATSGNSTK